MHKKVLGRLIALRKKTKLTASEVSQKLHRNEYYISKMENGVFFPPVKELEQILELYNSNLEELFYDEFEKFRMEKEVIERFRRIGQKEKDAILTLLIVAGDHNKDIANKGEGNDG